MIFRGLVCVFTLFASFHVTAVGAAFREVRVMTYNIQGLPVFIFSPKRFGRAAAELNSLRKQGRGVDVVFIQEGFQKRSIDLIQQAGYSDIAYGPGPYSHGGKNKKMNSGVFAMSDLPIIEKRIDLYSDCVSFDCLSNKGILEIVVEVPVGNDVVELSLQGTHLQADYVPLGVKHSSIVARRAQMAQWAAGLYRDSVQKKRPTILLGDLNMKSFGEDYLWFEDLTGAENSVEECVKAGVKNCDGARQGAAIFKKSLDHQWYVPGGKSRAGKAVTVTPIEVGQYFDGEGRGPKLSDHRALVVNFKIEIAD